MKRQPITIETFPAGKTLLERIADEAENKHEEQEANKEKPKQKDDQPEPGYTKAIVL